MELDYEESQKDAEERIKLAKDNLIPKMIKK